MCNISFAQMSDYDDLLTNDDDDMSGTESSATSCEWETEEEEQLPGNDTGNESGNVTSRFAVSLFFVYLCLYPVSMGILILSK